MQIAFMEKKPNRRDFESCIYHEEVWTRGPITVAQQTHKAKEIKKMKKMKYEGEWTFLSDALPGTSRMVIVLALHKERNLRIRVPAFYVGDGQWGAHDKSAFNHHEFEIQCWTDFPDFDEDFLEE